MAVELSLPGRRIPAPLPPSYLALDMAFGVGNPAILGDKSRYRSHGAITGAVPAAGVHGYCLDFDPTIPSYVEIPAAHTQLNFTSEDFSFVSRVYNRNPAAGAILFNRGLATTDGYYIYMVPSGSFRLYTNQALASQNTRSADGEIVANTWHTLGISRSGASATVYKNGVDITVEAGIHIDPLTCARSAKIGIYNDLASFPLVGQIRWVRFLKRALSEEEHMIAHLGGRLAPIT